MPLSKWFLSKKDRRMDSNRSGKIVKAVGCNEYGLSSNLFLFAGDRGFPTLGKNDY